jgi:hypothetical protein
LDLDLSGNPGLGTNTGRALGRLLATASALQRCSIRVCHTSIYSLDPPSPAHGSLTDLRLTGSHVDIVRALGCAVTVRTLDLSLCDAGIGDAGCRTLAAALVRCHVLRDVTLSLASNRIGCVGLRILSDALVRVPTLTRLTLGIPGNDVGVAGLSALRPLVLRLDAFCLDATDNLLRVPDAGRLAQALCPAAGGGGLREMRVTLTGMADSASERARLRELFEASWRDQVGILRVLV